MEDFFLINSLLLKTCFHWEDLTENMNISNYSFWKRSQIRTNEQCPGKQSFPSLWMRVTDLSLYDWHCSLCCLHRLKLVQPFRALPLVTNSCLQCLSFVQPQWSPTCRHKTGWFWKYMGIHCLNLFSPNPYLNSYSWDTVFSLSLPQQCSGTAPALQPRKHSGRSLKCQKT